MSRARLILCAAAVLAFGAPPSQAARPAPDQGAAGRPDLLPFKEFMGHVIQRNAEQLWAWSAEEVDAHGTRTGRPVDEQQWEDAESDALTLVELTHVLEAPGYAWPVAGWSDYVGRARAAAAASASAAERHDYPALQQAADQLNAACVACHLHYAPQLESGPPALPAPAVPAG